MKRKKRKLTSTSGKPYIEYQNTTSVDQYLLPAEIKHLQKG